MKRQPVDRSQVSGAVKAEVFVGRTACKGKQRWRWDVTFLRIVEVDRSRGNLFGADGRSHLGGECGYTRTQAGAWRALRRAFEDSPYEVV